MREHGKIVARVGPFGTIVEDNLDETIWQVRAVNPGVVLMRMLGRPANVSFCPFPDYVRDRGEPAQEIRDRLGRNPRPAGTR
jgi:hypothetical protein